MKRNRSTPISILCPHCRLHTTKLLSELVANNNVVCAYCEEIINLANEHWRTALGNQRIVGYLNALGIAAR